MRLCIACVIGLLIGYIPILASARLNYIDSIKQILPGVKNDSIRIEYLASIAFYSVNVSSEETNLYLKQLLEVTNRTDSEVGRAYYFQVLSTLTSLSGSFLRAIDLAEKASRAFQASGSTRHSLYGLNNICRIYYEQEQYDSAIFYQRKILVLAQAVNWRRSIGICASNLVSLYYESGQYDSASRYSDLAMEINSDLNNRIDLQSEDLKNLGFLFLKKGDFKQARASFLRSLEVGSQYARGEFTNIYTQVYFGLGQVLWAQDRHAEAIESLKKSTAYARKLGSFKWTRSVYMILVEYLDKSGQMKQAYRVQKEYLRLSNEQLIKKRKDELMFQQEYASTLREAQLYEIAKNEASLKQVIIEKQQQKMIIIFGGVILLGAVSLMLYGTNRKNKFLNELLRKRERILQDKMAELEKVNETKDTLFGVIGHDLRGPLASLVAFSELITKYTHEMTKESIAELGEKLTLSVKNALELTNNMLLWGKTQMQGTLSSNRECIYLRSQFNAVNQTVKETAARKNITIVENIPEHIQVLADKNHIQFIVRNLINNSLKFTPSGGQVHVQAELEHSSVKLTVRDTGVGIEKDRLEKIFSISSRSRSTKGTNGEPGTGLGLILIREFLLLNQGKISVDSLEGTGTTFRVDLPIGQMGAA